MFVLFFREKALKEFKSVPKYYQLKINAALDTLCSGNFRQMNIDKLQGTSHGYRLRVGRWRILFALNSGERIIEVVSVFLKKGGNDYTKRMPLFR